MGTLQNFAGHAAWIRQNMPQEPRVPIPQPRLFDIMIEFVLGDTPEQDIKYDPAKRTVRIGLARRTLF